MASPDKSKALIIFSDPSNSGYYLIYDINSSKFSNAKKCMNIGGNFVSDLSIQYFIRTQEYIFSGNNNNKQFKIVKFDKNLNFIQNENSNDENVYDYSLDENYHTFNFYNIIVIPDYGNYIFIIDGDLEGITAMRGYLFPDAFKPEEIFPITLFSESSIMIIPLTNNYSSIITTIPFAIKTKILSSITNELSSSITTTSQSLKISSISSHLTSGIKTSIPSTKTTTIQSYVMPTIPSSLINKIKSTISSIKTSIIQSHTISTIPSSLINSINSTYSNIQGVTGFIHTSTFPKNIISIHSFATISTSQMIRKPISKYSQLFTTKYSSFPFSSLIQNSLIKIPSISPPTSRLTSFFSSNHISSNFSTVLAQKTISSFLSQKNIYSSILQYTFYNFSEKGNNTVKINDESCSFEYFYKNIITNECEKFCSYNDFINEICYINNLTENNIMDITQNFRNLITKLEINENTNIVINGNNVVYQVISSEVMDENINKNITIIEFGECEEKLKKVFGIDYILILQMDIFLSTSTNIVMKYEVYNPYTLEKIDLSICNDMTINTYLPFSISNEDLELYIKLQELGYDLYNPNDSFYHDFCTPYTTDNKTDILLSDRRLDYYKNINFCEEGCTYKSYNYTNKKVECECQINNEINSNIDNIKFCSSLLLSTFFEIENFSNIKILKCFKLVFSKIGQIKNIGSYIFIILNLIYIIFIFIYSKNGKKQLFNIINTVIRNKTINMPIKKKKKIKDKIKNKNSKINNNIIINKNIIIYNNHKEKPKSNKNLNQKDKSENISDINNSTKKCYLKLVSPSLTGNFSKNKKILNNKSKKIIKSKENNKFIYNYNDFELNSLAYSKAIIYDKRTYSQYYCFLLKQKHLILFTFISKIDYNLLIIKLSLFIFSFSLYFTVNTLFFTDTTIHKLYETQGQINFIYSILNIIYSTIISSIITLFIKLLALSNKTILKLKSYKNRKKALKESSNIIKELSIKFSIYFIISFILLILFWYLVSAFCAVYNNSQLLLILNTLSSFIVSLIYPFGLYLLPGIFRITALRTRNKDKNCLFSFGNLISLF